jgi:hypothetical protein
MKLVVEPLHHLLSHFPIGTVVYVNDQGNLHRLDGPALINSKDGLEEWWVNGKKHRIDGPAITVPIYDSGIFDGYQREWWVNGEIHRIDGPARETPYGQSEWWIEGEHVLTRQEDRQHKLIVTFPQSFRGSQNEVKRKLIIANPEQVVLFNTIDKESQNHIFQVRPDLISKIPNLTQKLREKYSHEIELSKVDL